MKQQRKLEMILIVLLVILLSLISFIGVFEKTKNTYVNKVPGYILGEDLQGYRKVALDSRKNLIQERINYTQAKGKDTKQLEEEAAKYPDVDIEKCRETEKAIKARLKSLKLEDFTISMNQDTGRIELLVPQNDKTEYVLSDLTQKGEFKIVNINTEEVLLDNSDVKSAKVVSESFGGQKTVSLEINFNQEGTKKFKNVTKEFQNQIDVVATQKAEEENQKVNEAEEEKAKKDPNYEKKKPGKATKYKKVRVEIDDIPLMETSFQGIKDNGKLVMNFGGGQVNLPFEAKFEGAKNIAAIIENKPLEAEYTISENVYIHPTVNKSMMKTVLYLAIAIALIIALVLIVKYRFAGVMLNIISVGALAILLLVIRYTNCVLSVDGMFGILIAYMLNVVFNIMVLRKMKDNDNRKEKEIKKAYNEVILAYLFICVPMLILSIIACLNTQLSIYSLGMVLFWGTFINFIVNALLSKYYFDKLKV